MVRDVPLINPLKNYSILIVDADVEMAQVLSYMLGEMGFATVRSTSNGKDAVSLIQTTPFDFIITEWNVQQLDGIGLLEFIRKNPLSVNPSIPVIMLTGRLEQVDAALARDYGVNEYIKKPFTAKLIYSCLERIFEQPRSFVVAKSFVGPDRRSASKRPENIAERRSNQTAPTSKPKQKSEVKEILENAHNSIAPKIWIPDLSLKIRLGKNMKLEDFITFDIINKAQEAIESITSDALQWVNDNVNDLELLYEVLTLPSPPPTITTDIGNIVLNINSRAGTFGYNRASEIAYTLYLFTKNKLDPKNKIHQVIIQKHMQVLKTILDNKMSGDAGEIGEKIATDLKTLINKYSG